MEESKQLPWKVAFRVQFSTEKYGIKFHPAPLPDTGNGVYTIQILDVPRTAVDVNAKTPAQQYNDSLKAEQSHLLLRAGLYLTHINDTNLLNLPCEKVIHQLTHVPRPVKLRFVDVDAGVVTLHELKQGLYNRKSLSNEQIEALLVDPEAKPTTATVATHAPAQVVSSPLAAKDFHTYKLILLGTTGVGKSSVLSVGIHGATAFTDRPAATLEAEFGTFSLPDPDLTTHKMLRAHIWDTAGQERYRAMTRSHYRRADGALLVYDVGDVDSFRKLESWLQDLRDVAGDSVKAIMVVENKVDKLPEHLDDLTWSKNRPKEFVDADKVAAFCRVNGLLFARTSAKMNAVAYKWNGKPIADVVGTLLLHVHAAAMARDLEQQRESTAASSMDSSRFALDKPLLSHQDTTKQTSTCC
ncbi:unnamed protein product [Aphanomyces euteiches]